MTKWTEEEQQDALRQCRVALADDDNPYIYKGGPSAIVGSTYIQGEGSDIDCLFLWEKVDVQCIGFPGWDYGGSIGEGNESNWGSWKKGNINLLVTSSKESYNAWLTSAEVCRFLSLRKIGLTRDERVAIHNIVMDDSTAEGETESLEKEAALWSKALS